MENQSRQGAQAQSQVPAAEVNKLSVLKKHITDSVMERIAPMIQAKEIRIPENYSVGNALHSAWFILLEVKDRDKKPALEVCTKDSIANALFQMVTLGLSAQKKQVAFIVYGNKLVCQTEYHGSIALAKRYGNVKHVNAGVIYEKDVFRYNVNTNTGRKLIVEHSQELENIDDNKIRGAYAVLTFTDGSEPWVEIMNMDQIKKAWAMSKTSGDVHKNFASEMVKKTVINRACKLFITTSDDAALFEQDETDQPATQRDETVIEKGNRKQIELPQEYEDVTAIQPPDDQPVQVEENEEAPY